MATTKATRTRRANERRVTLVRVWADRTTVRSRAIVHLDDKSVEELEAPDLESRMEAPIHAFVEHANGDQEDVCTTCQAYLTRTEMIEGVGKSLGEVQVCSNPECLSHDQDD